jgi:hypothetical protein
MRSLNRMQLGSSHKKGAKDDLIRLRLFQYIFTLLLQEADQTIQQNSLAPNFSCQRETQGKFNPFLIDLPDRYCCYHWFYV